MHTRYLELVSGYSNHSYSEFCLLMSFLLLPSLILLETIQLDFYFLCLAAVARDLKYLQYRIHIFWHDGFFFFFTFCRIRFHYGHPDVFDRIFHFTRGGFSKASCGINLSEDIFAGNIDDSLFFGSDLIFLPLHQCLFLYRIQLNTKTWKCYSSWIHPSWKG